MQKMLEHISEFGLVGFSDKLGTLDVFTNVNPRDLLHSDCVELLNKLFISTFLYATHYTASMIKNRANSHRKDKGEHSASTQISHAGFPSDNTSVR